MGRTTRRCDAKFVINLALVLMSALGCHRKTPLERLESANARFGEGRLTGFSWAPLVRQTSRDTRRLAEAVSLLRMTADDRSIDVRRSRAIAHLVTGDADRAAEVLLAIPEASRDAAVWSDLATIAIARAEKGSAEALVDAIAAADSALALEPKGAEAHFNRALAIEKLGLRDAAADAWRRYLAVDANNPWANEARSHLQVIAAPLPAFDPAMAAARNRIAHGDPIAARQVVEQFPHLARGHAEIEVLARWGQTGDQQELAIARTIGRVLAARGDAGLTQAVDAIDRASEDSRRHLARAHVVLAEARRVLRASPTRAEPLFRNAAALFEQASSPMALASQSFAATAAFNRNQIAEARRELEAILVATPEDLRSLRASILWQLALGYAATADWGATLSALQQSAALFDRIGESFNGAAMRQLMSELYDVIGDRESAWKLRSQVLREVGRTTSLRTQNAISSISNDAAIRKRWRVARSMLNLEIAMAVRVDDRPSHADALMRRAVANYELRRTAEAARDLAVAREVGASMADPGLRARTFADIVAVESLSMTEPLPAIAKLTAAIDFHRNNGREMFLPNLYLARARAYRAMRDGIRARADVDAGITALETGRETLTDVTSRFGILDAGEELFKDAIADALARDDVSTAFAYAERARARALLDTMDDRPVARMEPTTVIIEFISLPGRLVTFVLTHDRLHAIDNRVDPGVVAVQASELRDAFASGRTEVADARSRRLYGELISPITNLIRDRERLIFVPDVSTASIPFAALRAANGCYLVETYTVGIAPSTAIYRRAILASQEKRARALVVATSESLPAVVGEARTVATLYPNATVLTESDASFQAFARQAREADIIHFAGHGESVADGSVATLLSIPGLIDVRQIERIQLSPTSVVVLAACNSARGELRWSEGTLSVARACLVAGARSVVATLWSIDDADASRFFQRLHVHLAAGMAPADAVRATQLEWITKRPNTGSMWAAVQAIGR